MAKLGPRDSRSPVLMTGWDATELKTYELQDGTSFQQVVGQFNAALAGISNELYNDQLWASLVSFTDRPEVNYRVGTSNGMVKFTEYGRPDAARAEREGHMLPLIAWDRALGWTWQYLHEEAVMEDIQADIADFVKDVRDRWRIQILTRLLQRGDDSGSNKGLGSSGYSAGFATAAASTSVDFTPPAMGGTTFDSDHEHYVGITGGAFTAAVFQDAKDELREHGHEPPYNFIIGTSDASTVKGLTGFVPVDDLLVRYGAMQDRALLPVGADSQGGYYIGTIDDFAVMVVRGMPQYYGFGWKSYGSNSQRNPLAIRVPKNMPRRPVVQAFPDPRSGAGAVYPLQYVMGYTKFGVGVNDRTNGTARYTNSATWADGTPT